MGLDQNIYKRKRVETEEVIDWRKNAPIQGWFEENFNIENMQSIRIDKDVMGAFMKDLDDKNFHETKGFFYGNQQTDDQWYKDTKEQIKMVIEDMDKNPDKEYFYTCWY